MRVASGDSGHETTEKRIFVSYPLRPMFVRRSIGRLGGWESIDGKLAQSPIVDKAGR